MRAKRLAGICLLFAATLAVPAAAVARTEVSGFRLGAHPDGTTRLALDTSAALSVHTRLLADPYRVVVEADGADCRVLLSVPKPVGAITSLRWEQGHLVIDLRRPATVASAFALSPRDGVGWRLVIDLKEASREQFLAAARSSLPVAPAPAPAPAQSSAPRAPAQAPAASPGRPQLTELPPAREVAVTPQPPVPPPFDESGAATPAPALVVVSPRAAGGHNETAPPAPPQGGPTSIVAAPAAASPLPSLASPAEAAPVTRAKPASVPVTPVRAGGPMLSAPMPPPPDRGPAAIPAVAAVPPAAQPPTALPAAPAEPPATITPAMAPVAPKAMPAPGEAHPNAKPVIVIDPGHGGVDPGATGISGIYEKYITLAVARELKGQLERNGHFRVHLTRDSDTFIPLRQRVALARQWNADLFISLHADVVKDPQIRGLSIYTLSQTASDAEAQALADKENKADLIAGIDLSHESADVANILIDLAQRETMNRSAVFAGEIVEELGQETSLLANTHRFAGFAVLKGPDVPAVLIETGYLSNEVEERNLRSPEYRTRLARAISKAVERYFQQDHKARRS